MAIRGSTARATRIRGLGDPRSIRIPGQIPRMLYTTFPGDPGVYAPPPIDYASLEMQNEQREADEKRQSALDMMGLAEKSTSLYDTTRTPGQRGSLNEAATSLGYQGDFMGGMDEAFAQEKASAMKAAAPDPLNPDKEEEKMKAHFLIGLQGANTFGNLRKTVDNLSKFLGDSKTARGGMSFEEFKQRRDLILENALKLAKGQTQEQEIRAGNRLKINASDLAMATVFNKARLSESGSAAGRAPFTKLTPDDARDVRISLEETPGWFQLSRDVQDQRVLDGLASLARRLSALNSFNAATGTEEQSTSVRPAYPGRESWMENEVVNYDVPSRGRFRVPGQAPKILGAGPGVPVMDPMVVPAKASRSSEVAPSPLGDLTPEDKALLGLVEKLADRKPRAK